MADTRLKTSEIPLKWKKRYGEILREIFDTYELDYYEFADEYKLNNATVRFWFTGRSFPQKGTQIMLNHYLLDNIKNDSRKDIHIYEYIQNKLGIENEDACQEMRRKFLPISEFLVEILHHCVLLSRSRSYLPEVIKQSVEETNKIKAVIFDFDGTLSDGKAGRTTWESIWTRLGYDVNECQHLHMRFNRNEITHAEWCKLTEDKFCQRKLHRSNIEEIAKKIELLPGIQETFEQLHQRDIKIFIVSGSILLVIQQVLGNLLQYIDGIRANRFFFDEDGFLSRIVGTKYDFEGKALFITETANDLQISPKDVLFIGNSINDQLAYQSGAKTLCINPKLTNIADNIVWNDCIIECKNLTDILSYLD